MRANAASYIAEMQQKIHAALGPLVPDIPYALLDFPDIRNVGDSAIWLGELAYFRKYFRRAPTYASVIGNFSPSALEQVVPEGPIFLHGGGNFGDIWYGHQLFRERVLQQWPDRLIIQLPQSLHFDCTDRLEQAKRVIDSHRNFILLVRDEPSLDLAQKHFNCRTILCPDMAFSIGPVPSIGTPQFPILAMLRKDKEQIEANNAEVGHAIPCEDWITEANLPVRLAALGGILRGLPSLRKQDVRIAKYKAKALQRFRRGVRQLSRANIVITDRLHVHIISLLMDKRHAVLDNSYGKIGRFRAAFPEPPGLTYTASSYKDAEDWARQHS